MDSQVLAPEVPPAQPGPRGRSRSLLAPNAARLIAPGVALATYLAGFAVASVALTVVLVVLHADPLEVYGSILQSSLGSTGALAETLNKMTPLLLGSVGVAFAMRAGYINLGIDGQIYGGALLATGAAFLIGGGPPWLVLPVLALASILGGGIVAAVPAILRVTRGTNELFLTVMLNFVAYYTTEYMVVGPWNEPTSGAAVSKAIPLNARLPYFLEGGGHIGILVALIVALAVGYWVFFTRSGFEFRAAGINRLAARYGGIRLSLIGIAALVISGCLGGLAGGIEVTGVHGRLILGMTPNYGLISVLIAALARRNPVAAIPVSFAFAVLLVGGQSLQGVSELPSSLILIYEGLVVLTILLLETGPAALLVRFLAKRVR